MPSLPGPLWPGMVAPDRVLSMGQVKLNSLVMLNGITWNRTMHTYAKLNCLKLNCFHIAVLMLNWIVRNRNGCRIHRLLPLPIGRNPINKCPVYDTETIWRMWSRIAWQTNKRTVQKKELKAANQHCHSKLPGPLWPGMVAPDRVLSMGQVIDYNSLVMLKTELLGIYLRPHKY